MSEPRPVPIRFLSAVILTGGESRRMGRDKALLPMPDGRPLVRWVADRLATFCDPVFAVDPSPERLTQTGIRAVPDRIRGRGPLAGLVTGLEMSPHRLALVVGCDMPFVEEAVVRLLLDRIDDLDAAVPVIAGRLQPLGAIYATSLLERAIRLVEERPAGLHELLAEARIRRVTEAELRTVDPTLASFANLNTPTDLAGAVAHASGRALP